MSIDDGLAKAFDAFIAARGYQNRSEAVRDLIRDRLEERRKAQPGAHCVASLSYVYDHHERELPSACRAPACAP
ncbi:MAG: nickel-responsive transcriptional regulator NikR [Steroidobacteraceae bacterium]